MQILHHSLRDRLEWDLSSPLTPEAFAAQLGKDLSLSGEALPLISAALREALLNHKRAVGELGLIGMGEMWGKAQREEDEARRDLEEEKRERKRRREEKRAMAQGLVPPPAAATGEAGQEASSPPQPPRVSIAATPASAASPPIGYASDDDDEDEADISGNTAAAEAAAKALLPASDRLAQALATKADLVARGPRQLVGAWRDWFESKEFGPLLEYLGDAEIERRETEGLRALRRNRREAARGGGGGGDGGAGPVPERYRPR